jgi:hypothetical protein
MLPIQESLYAGSLVHFFRIPVFRKIELRNEVSQNIVTVVKYLIAVLYRWQLYYRAVSNIRQDT